MTVSSAGVEERASQRGSRWARQLEGIAAHASASRGFAVQGTLTRMIGLTLEAQGCRAAVGSRCMVTTTGDEAVEAEVVGFNDNSLLLMPTGNVQGVVPGSRVVPSRRVFEGRVGEQILGRIVDGAGQPIDGAGALRCEERVELTPGPINPLERAPIDKPLDVGVRSINGLLTVGQGQRMGLFAGSGVGKSMLLGMMSRYTSADVIVVGLIGERGREVREFIANNLDEQSRRRAVVVATPADHPPLVRMHGALLASAIAEYFRDQGRHVLLLMDSLTRYAQAQREISLAIGEPPVTKGYPASVFAKLPQLVERAGNGGKRGGSITAFYTVLNESDDRNDPIADAARAVLDGHVVLSRHLADAGLYPAIDIEASISRSMDSVVTPAQRQLVQRFRQLSAAYARNRDLITVGAYAHGSDPRVDEAIRYWPAMLGYLQQDAGQRVTLEQSVTELGQLFDEASSAAQPEQIHA